MVGTTLSATCGLRVITSLDKMGGPFLVRLHIVEAQFVFQVVIDPALVLWYRLSEEIVSSLGDLR